MKLFDTNVQLLKYEVLKEIIKRAYRDDLANVYTEIPKIIAPGPKSTTRCCIYKERAIASERIKMAMGGDKNNPNPVEVMDIACDECPAGGIYITPACRGCLVHKCVDECPKGAITIKDRHAVIDKDKCVECGKCAKVCPYGAILVQHRPCIQSCKLKALSMDDNQKAVIDNDKCISCGACIYNCPFGAITDKSYVLDVIDILRKSQDNSVYKVYAIIAPAIGSQCRVASVGHMVTAIEKLGFYRVVEAALGADITLFKEGEEFKEKGLLTTSCCPSFVMFIEKNFPDLKKFVSGSDSPMVETAKLIKRSDPAAKVIFIGPCSSKKLEYRLPKTGGAVDCVLSFEELQAFLDAKEIIPEQLTETDLDNASYYGRIFAKAGGIKEGLTHRAAKLGIDGLKPISLNGIEECRMGLLKLRAGKALENFFEGMACDGGCINGALSLYHGVRNAECADKYGREAKEQEIVNSVELYKLTYGLE